MDDLPLAGKGVLITGAGAGIGRAVALEMAARGARIYFIELDAAAAGALEAELVALGVTVRGWIGDASQPTVLERVVAELRAERIVVDLLVNNIGIPGNTSDGAPTSFARWQQAMDTNVLGPLYLSRLVAELMTENAVVGASIVFISSIHETVCIGDEVYSASKAGLTMLIHELAVALAPQGIRVNGVAPGSCRQIPGGSPVHHAYTPLHHESVKPCYIARAVLFLASDFWSHHTTGTVLRVDGGLSLVSYANVRDIAPTAPPPTAAQRLRFRLGTVRQKARSLFP